MALRGENSVALWDIHTGRVTAHLRAELPVPFAFSGDGRSLVVRSMNEVPVGDVPSHRLRLRVPGGETADAAISTDGRRLAACGGRHRLQIWDTARRVPLNLPWTATYGRDFCSRTRLAFSPDGTTIALGSPTGVRIRNIASGRDLAQLDTETAADVRFSPDGAFAAATDDGGQVLLWRLASPDAAPVFRHTLGSEAADGYEVDFAAAELRYLDGSRTVVRSLALGSAATSGWRRHAVDGALLSRDGRTLATLRAMTDDKEDTGVRLWDTRTGKAVLTMPDKPCPAETAGPAPETGSSPELVADEETATTGGGEPPVASRDVDCFDLMALSADGRSFAYVRGSTLSDTPDGRRITVWDVSEHRRRASITIRPDRDGMTGVDGLALSPDGRTLYVSRTTTAAGPGGLGHTAEQAPEDAEQRSGRGHRRSRRPARPRHRTGPGGRPPHRTDAVPRPRRRHVRRPGLQPGRSALRGR